MSGKKGIVSYSLFTLVLGLLLLMFAFTYSITESKKDDFQRRILEKEIINSLGNFYYSLEKSYQSPNITIIQNNYFDLDRIAFNVSGKNINIRNIYDDDIFFQEDYSSLSIPFCSGYEFIPTQRIELKFNGSCVSINMA